MKSLIRWAIRNTPAMNTLMIAIMVVGAVSLYTMHREVFPEFDLEIILITVPYPGASPEEVEEGICQKIEESVRSVANIKKQYSVAREGAGTVVIELESDVPDVQKILNEVRSEIDRIPSFPVLAEDPEVTQITLRHAAVRIGVLGPDVDTPDAELALREVTEQIRNDLLQLPAVSQANIVGGKEYQIDIEIPEETLRKHGLTLKQVAQIVRRENLELPGGKMRTHSQDVLLRGKNRQQIGSEIEKIPLVTQPNGVVLTVGDLGQVRDAFADTTAENRINGRPGLVISIDKTATEDLLAIAKEVNAYIDDYEAPPGYEILTWADTSMHVRDRMELLGRNGLQGLVLVFLVLAVFLEKRLAFWVALGIPISMLGGAAVLIAMGQTLNMLSMFAFLMALGILVDDAIVVGENVYAHRQMGKSFIPAAVEGTYEVLPAVIASVTTTIIAFSPLLFVPGIMGKFIAVMPIAVIAMLIISLVESTFILPCHLAHSGEHDVERAERRAARRPAGRPTAGFPTWKVFWIGGIGAMCALVFVAYRLQGVVELPSALADIPPFWMLLAAVGLFVIALAPVLVYPLGRLGSLFDWLNQGASRILKAVIDGRYSVFLRWSLENPALVICAGATILLLSFGLIKGGIVPFEAFPKLDGDSLIASVAYPDGTSKPMAERATIRLEKAIREIDEDYRAKHDNKPLVRITHRAVGDVNVSGEFRPGMSPGDSHKGTVGVELVPTDQRKWSSQEVIKRWREKAGGFPGAESLTFKTMAMGPGGTAIEFKLLAPPEKMARLEQAVEKCTAELARHQGVFDIADNSRPGKWEFQLKVKEDAKAMGVSLADLAETVRASYYGEEVMRLQRGRHEVKLMVRYPESERRSVSNFEDIRVRTGTGAERPLTELADVTVRRGYSEINRMNQLRSVTITADVDATEGNARRIVTGMQNDFMPELLKEHPSVSVVWEGQQEQTVESVTGLIIGLAVALIVMFALLTLVFRSYVQPVLILLIIPFGAIGAVAGHMLLGLPVTLFSLFGLVALTGVVVNDSIVLIDFINRRVRDGIPIKEALVDAGRRRFRPVLLTSLTTIAGLLPILLETSFQAQVLIPMATSLAFGLMFATVMVLILIPTFYLIYHRIVTSEPPTAEVVRAYEPPVEPIILDGSAEVVGPKP